MSDAVQVLLQTNFTDPSVIYDSNAPASQDSAWKAFIMDAMKPVVQVKVGDAVLYKTGDFYDPTGKYWLIGFAAVALIGIAAIMAKMSNK